MSTLARELRAKIDAAAARYPNRRSAIMPALHLAQDSEEHLTKPIMEEIAEILDVAPIHVYEIATFYTMFRTDQVGRYHIQLCNNVSCMLLGANRLLERMEKKLGIKNGETTADGRFTLSTVECLGSCDTAPMLQLNDRYIENLTEPSLDELLDSLADQAPAIEPTVVPDPDSTGPA